jgi:hypothetical protein
VGTMSKWRRVVVLLCNAARLGLQVTSLSHVSTRGLNYHRRPSRLAARAPQGDGIHFCQL